MLVPLLAPLLATVVFAQEDTDSVFPDSTGGRLVFALFALVIVGLYFLIRRTQRRSEDAYWRRRKTEQELRDNDPDMRHDD